MAASVVLAPEAISAIISDFAAGDSADTSDTGDTLSASSPSASPINTSTATYSSVSSPASSSLSSPLPSPSSPLALADAVSPCTAAAAHYRSSHLPAILDHPAIRLQDDQLRVLIGTHRTLPECSPDDDHTVLAALAALTIPKSVAVPTVRGRFTRWSTTSHLPDRIMTVVAEEESALVPAEDGLPASPPGLVFSKSSKSSYSLPSDSDDQLSDIALNDDSHAHFEDLALDDPSPETLPDSNLPPDSRPTLRRRSPPAGSSPNTQPSSPPFKQYLNGRRQLFPSLHGAVTNVLRDQSLNLPAGRPARSQSSPTSPSAMHHPERGILSRSPSPQKRYGPHGYSYVIPQPQQQPPHARDLPSPMGRPSPHLNDASNGQSRPMPRRMSWQPPARKSVQELEDEYNDADEDVPDEAVLENVPISPMPGQHASAFLRSASTPSLRSHTPSPHRLPSYANLHSANIPKNAKRPTAPPNFGTGHYSSPRSPNTGMTRPPMPAHGSSPALRPMDEHHQQDHFSPKPCPAPLGPQHRSKSWTMDLNDEARQLSQALEEYADQLTSEKRGSGSSSVTSSPPRPSIAKHRSKTSTADLPTIPPKQKSNVMIDPLPISKEKEAVLTRTRPSWLPPKDPKEEKRHLKEFQQMMARAAEAEKKRELRTREARESREEMQGNIARIWDQHVLPNWDTVIHEPRTRELWWRGVTPRSRGEVWQRAIGNDLELAPASFDAALARAAALEEKVSDLSDEERAASREAAWLDAIARDVPSTFPELQMYQPGAALHDSLTDVLKAYAMYRSDVGYVYGTHLAAGIICLILPPPTAFVVLANLLNRPLPLAFLVHDRVAMAHTYDLVLSTLKYKFTKLHDHLTSPALALPPHEFLDPLFRCLFAYHLPHEHAARIWDVYMFEGDRILIRAAVAVLGRLESKLYGSRAEILSLVGWSPDAPRWNLGSEDDFVQALRDAGKVDVRGSSSD